MRTSGLLVFVVGPSGVGKDSIISELKNQSGPDFPVLLAPRWCTRSQAGGPGHLACSADEFSLLERLGCLRLTWHANGHSYGIGREIDWWLQQGAIVLINGSRAHLRQALQQYPQAAVLEISADPDVVAQRLHDRGREDAEAIAERLRRTPSLPAHRIWARVANDGPLSQAVKACRKQLLQWCHQATDADTDSPNHQI